jgi:hypothetical protein
MHLPREKEDVNIMLELPRSARTTPDELLALRIIETARLGERDERRLRDDALLHLTDSDLRSSGL